jgi:hypothetical protein
MEGMGDGIAEGIGITKSKLESNVGEETWW